ncbi:uncharacterized protein LOC122260132 [Penaeus japonicus]|uniref:uncharacterized protein LOC122260132 n=1 Tax=Penaeus japonicus TaxID=27405 RepID=UPI001C712511|nr:uncharacterized protein LOC122260132 [Penaeus japonicus]
MRIQLILLTLAAAVTVTKAQGLGIPRYTWQEVRQNLATHQDVTEMVDCTLGIRPTRLCRHMFNQLRGFVYEVVQRNCIRCPPQTRRVVNQAVAHLQRNYTREFNRLIRGVRS